MSMPVDEHPQDSDRDLTIVGYCEPVSVDPGARIDLKLSSHESAKATVDIVRLICGDAGNPAVGFVEEASDVPGFPTEVSVTEQPINPGSFATFGPSELFGANSFTIGCAVRPSMRSEQVAEIVRIGQFAITWRRGSFGVDIGGSVTAASVGSLPGYWYELRCTVDAVARTATLTIDPVATRSPGTDSTLASTSASAFVGDDATAATSMEVGRGYDGRVSGLWMALAADATKEQAAFRWDASVSPQSRTWHDRGEHALHGEFFQLPTRAVRGPAWTGESQTPTGAPDGHYDAVHFHTDDLYDAGWATSASVKLPDDLASGIYCFRSATDTGIDRTPFFVSAPKYRRARIAYLAPVATYLAYANQRIQITNSEFFAPGAPTPPHHRYVETHSEVGYSMYEYHPDRSGVMFSSHRRPVLNMKPGADGWAFTPDSNIVAFLHHVGLPFDVVSDEHLHTRGSSALDGYDVIVTGSHPEYWSTPMLDTLATWQSSGGRLMYLGGNGFYWRVAFSEAWPGAMEVRRAEDGTRAWVAESGEYHHAFGGEYGGLWRRMGRAPNHICGVGFVAQGFSTTGHFVRTHEEPARTNWIFEGVNNDDFGQHGVGGGAAGQEIDRFDQGLGSPPHAVIVASATDFGPDMLRTKEEFHVTVPDASASSKVRADMVFYEVAGGGAVFSVGSISWFGALATDSYRNDVSTITENVLRRFADPTPFELP
jgi:N,N-dimethylformamidase